MQCTLFLTLLLSLSWSQLAGAVPCGKWYSNKCLADTDIRYDKSVSNNFVDQAPIWGRINGYYKATGINYMGNGMPADEPTHYFEAIGSGFPYEVFPSLQFANISTVGSRYREHRIIINAPATQAFCNETVPEGGSNVINIPNDTSAICGQTGFISYAEGFSTTSQEKDGRALQLPLNFPTGPEGYKGDDDNGSFPSPSGNAIFTSSTAGEQFLAFDTLTCIDKDCNQITRSTDSYFKTDGETAILGGSARLTMTRVATEEEWVAEINAAYESNGIIFPIAVPFTADCLGQQTGFGRCPTEEEWCLIDPECVANPLYVEPDGTVDAGVIAGFTVAFFVLIIIALYVWHRHVLRQQAERNRVRFARRIAETIKLEGSNRQLTAEGLADEFKKRSAADGTIGKDELWDFISSGQAVAMGQSDFDALFAAIDLDDSGSVDFLEFCTYMGQCNEEFERVKGRKSILRARPSFALQSQGLRSSLAEMTARKIVSTRVLQVVHDDEDEEHDDDNRDNQVEVETPTNV